MDVKFSYLIGVFFLLIISTHSSFTTDTLSFQWPYHPFHETHNITGAFAEYRTTSPGHHFHDGVDIPIPDNYPVYPSLDGVVHSIGTVADHGGGAWVRVRTQVDGLWKHISYVHVAPNPGLSVGDPVEAGETVLGTIIPGWGHVHFRERELVSVPNANGADINAIREGGGLTPYIDDRKPVIFPETLQFRRAGTTTLLDPKVLHGNVQILIQAHGHYGPELIHQRRGIYKLGYHIMSEDTTAIVYSPPDDGLRYQFDRKPTNSHVNRVFVREYSTNRIHYYYLTGGHGASYINQSLTVDPNYLDTSQIPNGNYVIKIFAEDTRQNADTIYIPISINQAPAAPMLRAVMIDDNDQITIQWHKNTDDNLGGYRLYYNSSGDWTIAVTESLLTAETTFFTIDDPDKYFTIIQPHEIIDFAVRLVAVNDILNPLESLPSIDFYLKNAHHNGDGHLDRYSVLIVDGIQEGDEHVIWNETTHPFIVHYGSVLPHEAVISSTRESAVVDSTVILSDYDVVIWFIGTRGFQSRSFTGPEQEMIKDYLEQGGKLIVSGSAIGLDLARPGSEEEIADSLFYSNYLRADFFSHSVAGFNPTVNGFSGTGFSEYRANFNQVYAVSWTDDINPLNGAGALLYYQTKRPDGSQRIAAVGYRGPFGDGVVDGGVVYFAFPVETIGNKTERWELFVRTFQYFDFVTAVTDSEERTLPAALTLSSNYPNPFNMMTQIDVGVPERSDVRLYVYDVLGRKVATLIDEHKEPGLYTVLFDAAGLASGTYYARLKSGNMMKTQSMILLK